MLYEAHGIKKFIVVCGYTDLRKGIPGLSQIIEGSYQMNPFERDVLFLFCGRRGDRIKALLYEQCQRINTKPHIRITADKVD